MTGTRGNAVRPLEMNGLALVDELVVVTPGLDRLRRIDSYLAVAMGWRQAL